MRVAVFTGLFPALSETFIVRQITGLIDLGHEVDVYAQSRPESEGPLHPQVAAYRLLDRTHYLEIPPEAGYWEMPAWPPTGKTWLPGADKPISNSRRLVKAAPVLVRCLRHSPGLTIRALAPSEYGHQARSLSSLYRLHDLCSHTHGEPYSVLHAHFGPVANSVRFARQLWKAPLVASFHGYDFSTWPRKHGRDVYASLFKIADAVTVNSNHSRSRLEDLGCPREKLHKLPMGVNPESFPYHARTPDPGGEVRLLTVGRLVEKKGIEYSIRAVARALTDFPGLRYDIIGDGPLRLRLEALVRELGVHQKVTIHGAGDEECVRRAMLRAHLFVLAAVTASDGDEEGQGLVLQEAQATGLPVLATQHNGFGESILPVVSGFLVPERDVEGLESRLRYLLEHIDTWPSMGFAGRQHVERHYDIRKLNGRLVDLYGEVIERYRLEIRRS